LPTRFRVREVIDERGLTQLEVARRARLSYSTVSRLYLEQATQISLKTLDRLAEVLRCEPGDLLERVRASSGRGKRGA
jgi:DNA-binding Xre family transcriptional regulator